MSAEDSFEYIWTQWPRQSQEPPTLRLTIQAIDCVKPLDGQFGVDDPLTVPAMLHDVLFGQPEPTEAEVAAADGNTSQVPPLYGERITRIRITGAGHVLVSFTGKELMWHIVSCGNVYGASTARVSLVETAARTRVSAGAAVRSVGSRAGVFSLGFVTFFNVAEWMSQPVNESDLEDLIVDVGVDLAFVSDSIIAGTLASAALLLLAPAVATVAVLIGVGIGAGIVAGLALDWLDSRLDIKDSIRSAMDNGRIDITDPVL